VVRKVLFLGLFLTLGLILLPRQFNRYPVQSLVNAPTVELRSPVEAIVLSTQPSTGRYEAQASEVVQIRPRLEDQLQALRAQEALLSKRLAAFLGEERHRLQQELIAREGDLRRADVELAATGREMQRQKGLVAAGFISPAQLDTLVLRHESAEVQREIAAAHSRRAQANLNALAEKGLMGERAGGVDVSYTQQRLDEVRVRIAELDAWTSRVTGVMRVGERTASVRTPGRGLLMGPLVTEGAFLAPGDLLARYVMCDQGFIDLAVPVSHINDYRKGGDISFRVAGEWTFYKGQVTHIFPIHLAAQKLTLAASPEDSELGKLGRVWIRPEPEFIERMRQESHCMIGQKVHAKLPRETSSILNWLSYLADVL